MGKYRIAFLVAFVGLGLMATALLALRYLDTPEQQAGVAGGTPNAGYVPLSPPTVGGPFTLLDHRGRAVSDRDFHGSFLLVFFGYTYCPDVCPTELQTIAQVLDILGAEGALGGWRGRQKLGRRRRIRRGPHGHNLSGRPWRPHSGHLSPWRCPGRFGWRSAQASQGRCLSAFPPFSLRQNVAQ